jgi:gamma-glutamyltranspeptidase/glutathione hydrolase
MTKTSLSRRARIAACIAGLIGSSCGAPLEGWLPGAAASPGGSGPRSHEPVVLMPSTTANATGRRHLVAATTGRPAMLEGVALLDAGGNALDAALGIALDQIVLSGGSWNSFAGIAALLYYDAASGRAYALDGSYRSFAAEVAPETIPRMGTPSGRTALVPGFMALVQAAHDRFGRLPLERLFEPAIAHAEDGIVVGDALDSIFPTRADVLTRLEPTAAIYAPGGRLPVWGDIFRQPALAETLRHVAREGAGYMYRGAWAERFVAAVRAEGGQATLEDLAGYAAEWSAPRCVAHSGADVCSTGGRGRGGAALLESLLVAEAAGLPALGAWSETVDALYWTVRASQVGLLLEFGPDSSPDEPSFLVDRLPGVAHAVDERLTLEQARRLVEHVASGRWDQSLLELFQRTPSASTSAPSAHSDGVVVIDDAGNAACLIHSSNTVNWGTTGLNVDGVSIPDSASFQQGALSRVGPGAYLGSMLNPALVLVAGELRLAASSIGNIHYAMFGALRAYLELHTPLLGLADEPVVSGGPYAERVPPGSASEELLTAARARGLRVESGADPTPVYWLAIERHSGPPAPLAGVVTRRLGRFGGGVEGR